MSGFTWVDGPFGGTPVTAANLNAAMGVSDAAIAGQINTPASQTAAALNATYVPFWKPTTAYTAGQQVTSPNGDVVSAIATHTSGASFNPANWNISPTFVTPAQAAGAAAGLAIVFGGR